MMLRKTYSTNLALLLKGICDVPSALDTHISGLAIDSREVKKGDLFLAISGHHSKSTDHIKDAIERGANAIVAEGSINKGKVFEDGVVVELFVDSLKDKVGQIADRFYRSPSSDLSVIGVTGTNGKTSVTHYLASYFSEHEVSAVMGTLGFGIVTNDNADLKETGFTTPNVVAVHRCLATLRDAGVKNVFMEVSSHGLSQGRVDAVKFEGAVFTNLTHEHLDYHGSMQEYAASKARLFSKEGLKYAVINDDDAYSGQFKDAITPGVKLFTFGIKSKADISVSSYQLNKNAMSALTAEISTPVSELTINSSLIGLFNLSNLLAVIGVAIAKQALNQCEQKISAIQSVSGRMQLVHQKNRPTVVIDFAHTPDALENALLALKAHCEERLVLVFGCGGDRDKAKRKTMAKIAENIADLIIVTDDNPRNESAEFIAKQIFEGFENKSAVHLEHNREAAIELAISLSSPKDLVLIAGKGHEQWQEVKGEKKYFSDIDVVRRVFGIQEALEHGREAVV